jgi:hypothetical protein
MILAQQKIEQQPAQKTKLAPRRKPELQRRTQGAQQMKPEQPMTAVMPQTKPPQTVETTI